MKPVLSDHIKPDIFLALQIGGCLLLYESHLSEKPKICLVVQVALHRFDCSFRQFFTWLHGGSPAATAATFQATVDETG